MLRTSVVRICMGWVRTDVSGVSRVGDFTFEFVSMVLVGEETRACVGPHILEHVPQDWLPSSSHPLQRVVLEVGCSILIFLRASPKPFPAP